MNISLQCFDNRKKCVLVSIPGKFLWMNTHFCRFYNTLAICLQSNLQYAMLTTHISGQKFECPPINALLLIFVNDHRGFKCKGGCEIWKNVQLFRTKNVWVLHFKCLKTT